MPPPHRVTDRAFTLGTGAVCVALVPAFVAGVPVWAAAAVAVAVLVALTAWRRPQVLRNVEVPWRTLLAVLGLFAVVETAHRHGLDAVAARAARRRLRVTATCCAPPPSARSARTC